MAVKWHSKRLEAMQNVQNLSRFKSSLQRSGLRYWRHSRLILINNERRQILLYPGSPDERV